MKLLLSTLCIIFPILLSASQMQSRELSTKDIKTQSVEIVKLAASELSKSIPKEIDKYTKLVAIKADGTTLIYTFEINIAPKSDEAVKKNDYARMKEAVTYGTCKNSKRFIDADISIRYIYKSQASQAELFKFDIDKNSCYKL